MAESTGEGGVLNPLTVHIPVLIPDDESLFNGLLVFKTLRTGFPNANVHVWDNGSAPHLVREVEAAAKATGCSFSQAHRPIEHGTWIVDVLQRAKGPVVLCDTDVVFWESMESYWPANGALFAGRLIPEFTDGHFKHYARIHPSLMWVPDPAELLKEMRFACPVSWDNVRAFGYWQDGTLHSWDTCAGLYANLSCFAQPFAEAELNKYDHLFLGTTSGALAALGLSPEAVSEIKSWHAMAKADISSLRGLWRKQQHVEPLWEWQYVSGLLKNRFAFTACRFDRPQKVVHVSVTDLETGAFYFDAIPGARLGDIKARFGDVGIALTRTDWVEHGIQPRPGGWSKHRSAPHGSAYVSIEVNGVSAEDFCDVWVDEERSTVAPGTPWSWMCVSLNDGTRMFGYQFPDQPEISWSSGTVPPDFSAISPVSGDCRISDPWTGTSYTERFYWVYSQGERIGYAFAEMVFPGWPYERPGPLEMYKRWSAGNPAAADLMRVLATASQLADDMVDNAATAQGIMQLFNTATVDLQHNYFYLDNKEAINAVIQSAMLTWDASNDWADSTIPETRMFAYAFRESTIQVLATIALLAGGTEHARRTLREIHWYYHTGRVESFAEWEAEHARE